MEVSQDFVSRKLETMQRLWELENPDLLDQVQALLNGYQPTPQEILDLIDERRALAKNQEGTPIEDFLKEIADL